MHFKTQLKNIKKLIILNLQILNLKIGINKIQDLIKLIN